MLKCPYCGADSSEEYNFCVGCEKQLKCSDPQCGSLLVAVKTRCLKCGRSLVIQESPTGEMNSYIRTVDQTAKTYRERTEIRASDDAIGQMTPLLSGVPAFRPARPTSTAFPNNQPLQNLPLLVDSGNADQIEEADEASAPSQPSMSGQGDAPKKALTIFVLNKENGLVAKVRDFKGKSKKEQQKRLVVLAAWAYYQLFQKPVPSKEYLKAVATNSKLFDGNFRDKYLPETLKEYMTSIGDTLILNSDGEKKATSILAEIEDGTVDGAAYWEASAKTGKKLVRTSKEDQQKVEEWAQDKLDTGSLDIRSLGSPRNYAMFALWAITVKLKKASAVKPREAFLYILKRYTTIPVKSDKFTRSLSRTENAKIFAKNTDGLYYLEEQGQKTVESWIEGRASPKPEASP